jgi:Ca-activated chloride channel family protein
MFFRYPLFFLLLIPALFAIVVFLRSERMSVIFMRGTSFGSKTSFLVRFQYWVFIVSIFLSMLLFLIILASPQKYEKAIIPPPKTQDITFVVDLSYSMLAEDIAPNRIESAKKLLRSLVEKAPSDVRFALVVFAAHPFLASPPTLDHERFLDIVDYLSVNMIDQSQPGFAGTAL